VGIKTEGGTHEKIIIAVVAGLFSMSVAGVYAADKMDKMDKSRKGDDMKKKDEKK
jgi:hypothetical protein